MFWKKFLAILDKTCYYIVTNNLYTNYTNYIKSDF